MIPENWKLIITIIIAIYEVLVRYIPSIGQYSIIAWIIALLQWLINRLKAISDKLDRKKY